MEPTKKGMGHTRSISLSWYKCHILWLLIVAACTLPCGWCDLILGRLLPSKQWHHVKNLKNTTQAFSNWLHIDQKNICGLLSISASGVSWKPGDIPSMVLRLQHRCLLNWFSRGLNQSKESTQVLSRCVGRSAGRVVYRHCNLNDSFMDKHRLLHQGLKRPRY